MSLLNTDRKKGSLCFLISLILGGGIYLITKEEISILYLIPGLFLILANIFWFTKHSDRKITFHRK
jgi:drug/metabolite transporter (DMT)-like permease